MDGNTKLLINLKEGIVQVEGAEDFVRHVYNDFKERVSKPIVLSPASVAQIEQLEGDDAPEEEKENKHRKAKPKRTNNSTSKTGETANYKPKFNNDLNLVGLAEFYEKHAPSNHNEKILVFVAFLRDKMGKSPCAADDIYTCYFTMKNKTKIPGAFLQAFWNCQSRTHYIRFTSPNEIEVAIPGDNFLSEKIKSTEIE